MNLRTDLITWGALAIIMIGIVAIVALGLRGDDVPPTPPTRRAEAPTAILPATPIPSGAPLVLVEMVTETPTAVPSTELPPLPSVPILDGGQVIELTPTAPGAAGWVRQGDESPNHLGDYNIYAGLFDEQSHIGAVQFELSVVPRGAPITYADLILTGLSDEWLGSEGAWTVELLEPWMDIGWQTRDYAWLSRPDSAAGLLLPPLERDDLGVGRANLLFFPPQLLPLLEARVYGGSVSLRVTGPMNGADNLFAWDSGRGSGSLGRGPVLRLVVGPAPLELPPSPTPRLVIITPVPDGIVEQAARLLTATVEASAYAGPETPTPPATSTPLPPNWVTPVIIVPTATPGNVATATWVALVATSQVIVHGPPTPWPLNAWTATPTPLATPVPLLVPYTDLTATPTATATPSDIPAVLVGKIAFLSDRTGKDTVMIMESDGTDVAIMTDPWAYFEAYRRETQSRDGRYRLIVQSDQARVPQIFLLDLLYGTEQQLTQMAQLSYDPAFSPTDNRIVFVSAAAGNDEIFSIWPDGSNLLRLTHNQWEWDKHPSWSPDGSQIAFWSNRETTRRQIWRINGDGSNPKNISSNDYNDWNPVWIK